MSTLLVQSGTLDDIADAIRAKTGKVASMTPLEMPQEIASISGGSGVTILSGTSEPTASQGSNGQIYLKTVEIGEDLTTFSSHNESDMTITKNTNSIIIDFNGGQAIGAEAYKQIDLTNIDELQITIHCGNKAYGNNFTSRHPRVVITTSSPNYQTSPVVAEVSTANTKQTFTIDVSSYTGNYYIIFSGNGVSCSFSSFFIYGQTYGEEVSDAKLKVNGTWQNLIGSDIDDVNLGS